jgi:hypothetical protein
MDISQNIFPLFFKFHRFLPVPALFEESKATDFRDKIVPNKEKAQEFFPDSEHFRRRAAQFYPK